MFILYSIQEALTETAELGSPVAEYELEAEAEEAAREAEAAREEERRKYLQQFMPAEPPDKGILMSPNFRLVRELLYS